MQIKVNAYLFGADTFYSAKSQKNYHTISLLVDKASCKFFVNEDKWGAIIKSKAFNNFDKSGAPTPANVVFDIYFNDKGLNASVVSIED